MRRDRILRKRTTRRPLQRRQYDLPDELELLELIESDLRRGIAEYVQSMAEGIVDKIIRQYIGYPSAEFAERQRENLVAALRQHMDKFVIGR